MTNVMVITNVENYHKIPNPDCRGNPFFVVWAKTTKKDWNGKREIAPEKYLKEKIYDMIPNRCGKKSYENAESNG